MEFEKVSEESYFRNMVKHISNLFSNKLSGPQENIQM